MEFNIADLMECVADAVPAREAVVCNDERCTYAELDTRATRVAHALRTAGVQPGSHVGLYLRNSVAHLEVMLACYKARAVPFNECFLLIPQGIHDRDKILTSLELFATRVMPRFA